ncbi:MAG TPA: class I SAM-dependent methyltransferase [Thermoanaerobaculia bacterium]|nr:class I SAM-dependent methyltransferase [Thermoanaerobaculia bacterium]
MNPNEYETMYRVEERYWWYRGMRRIARRAAPGLFRIAVGERLLDVACGTGANLADMAPPGGAVRGVGLDLSLAGLRLCRRRGLSRLVLGRAEELPFRSGVFSGVSCRDALGCVPDDSRALREIARVAGPGAPVYLTVAALRAFAGDQDAATHVLRRYTVQDLRWKAEAAGLSAGRSGYANFLLSPAIFAVRRLRALILPKRETAAVRSEFDLAPGLLNAPLTALLGFEAKLLGLFRFPFGVSAFYSGSKRLD